MKGTITQIRQLTHDTKSFHINLPGHKPYKSGQFLVLTIKAQGKTRKRAYSIVSPPHWENVEIIVKLHKEGKVTPVLFSMQEGDSIKASLPYGTFYLEEAQLPEKICLLAGGVGLSAMLSIARHLEHINYTGECVLIYGNRTPEDIIYKDELDRIASASGMKVIYTIDHPEGTDWKGEIGYISPEMIAKYSDVKRSHFYMCGPPQMVGHMIENLERLGVEHERIKHEQW